MISCLCSCKREQGRGGRERGKLTLVLQVTHSSRGSGLAMQAAQVFQVAAHLLQHRRPPPQRPPAAAGHLQRHSPPLVPAQQQFRSAVLC